MNKLPKIISISFAPHNKVADKLYQSLGFQPTGKIVEWEVEMVLNLKSNKNK